MGAISLCEMFPLEALVSPTALLPLLWPSAAVKVLVEGVSLLFIECQAPSHAASVPLMLAAHLLSCGLGKGWPWQPVAWVKGGLVLASETVGLRLWPTPGAPYPPRVSWCLYLARVSWCLYLARRPLGSPGGRRLSAMLSILMLCLCPGRAAQVASPWDPCAPC